VPQPDSCTAANDALGCTAYIIQSRRVLHLIKMWLECPVEEALHPLESAAFSRRTPQADSCGAAKVWLLDYLIGAGEEHRGQFEAERFGGLGIDSQHKFGRQLNRKLRRLGATENAIDIGR
jgi:hypothetical protein